MKKNLFCFWILTVLFIQINFSLKAQIFSEAPVIISVKGERLSNMIYVKVKSSGYVEIPEGYKYVDGNSISNKFSNIHRILIDFCTGRQIDLSELKISKAIANAKEDDAFKIVSSI